MSTGSGSRVAAPLPLRIVHIFGAPAGGILRHVIDLVKAQQEAGQQVGLVCDAARGDDEAEGMLELLAPSLTLGLIRTPMKREATLPGWRRYRALKQQLGGLSPTVLHGHGPRGGDHARTIGTSLRASGNRVARIYTPHGGNLHREGWRFGDRMAFRRERSLARRTDAFIFVSEFERDAYLAKIGPITVPMAIARNGLPPEDFATITPVEDAADFLFAGEMSARKGLDLFIAALALIRHRTGAAPTAVIAGSGPQEEKYRAVVSQLGLDEAVAFHPAMPMRQAMTLAHAVVMSSRQESMPYVAIEAAAAGVPLVATNVGGVAEIFGLDADRLVPPGDAGALADAMAEMKEAPGAALAAAAALGIRLRSAFTIEAMAATVEGVYSEVVAG